MKCQDVNNLITRYLLKDLDEAGMKEVREHLEQCEGCRAEARVIEPTLDLLREALSAPPATAPAHLSRERMQAVLASKGNRTSSIISWVTSPRPWLRRAAMWVVVCGVLWIVSGRIMWYLAGDMFADFGAKLPAAATSPLSGPVGPFLPLFKMGEIVGGAKMESEPMMEVAMQDAAAPACDLSFEDGAGIDKQQQQVQGVSTYYGRASAKPGHTVSKMHYGGGAVSGPAKESKPLLKSMDKLENNMALARAGQDMQVEEIAVVTENALPEMTVQYSAGGSVGRAVSGSALSVTPPAPAAPAASTEPRVEADSFKGGPRGRGPSRELNDRRATDTGVTASSPSAGLNAPVDINGLYSSRSAGGRQSALVRLETIAGVSAAAGKEVAEDRAEKVMPRQKAQQQMQMIEQAGEQVVVDGEEKQEQLAAQTGDLDQSDKIDVKNEIIADRKAEIKNLKQYITQLERQFQSRPVSSIAETGGKLSDATIEKAKAAISEKKGFEVMKQAGAAGKPAGQADMLAKADRDIADSDLEIRDLKQNISRLERQCQIMTSGSADVEKIVLDQPAKDNLPELAKSVPQDEGLAKELLQEEEQVTVSAFTNAVAMQNAEKEIGPRFKAVGVNPVIKTIENPFSTFGIDVDTASYTVTRNHIQRIGVLPPAEAVRTEEFVNFFDYAYAAPSEDTFKVYVDGAPSKFGHGQVMLKIGVKGRRLGREEKRQAMLTLMIDTSGSMEKPDRLGLIQKAVRLLVESLDPEDKVAIVQFSSHARVALEPTPASNKKEILAILNALQCSGSTNFEEGMNRAYEVAAKSFVSKGENRVLILSDGAANLGNTVAQELLAKAEQYRKQGIYCSVFGLGMGTYNDAMLEELADKGNGTYAYLDTEEEARRLFVNDLAATLNTIAADVKIQVEFNPKMVAQYRQLGYENRQLKKEQFRDDTVDAGEVGSGQSVTALYEFELARQLLVAGRDPKAQQVAVVRVRYRRTDTGKIEEIEKVVTRSDIKISFDKADARFKLAACAAEFAEILRGSPYAGGSDLNKVAEVMAPVALELNLDARVQQLLNLVQSARDLPRAEMP